MLVYSCLGKLLMIRDLDRLEGGISIHSLKYITTQNIII